MKKEDLTGLGIEDELVKQIMSLHGKTVTSLNTKINALEGERDQFKEQLASNQSELDALKESSKGNEEITSQLEDLQSKYDEIKNESEKNLTKQQKDFAIKLALKDANALDDEIVLGQLNQDTIQVTDDGLQGFKEQLESLKENKPFLFQKEQEGGKPTPQIVATGNPVGGQGEGKSLSEKIQERLKG